MLRSLSTLRVRWLGSVPYAEAESIQRGLHTCSSDDHLLLLEHPHVYTLGSRASLDHVLVPPAEVGADLVRADRGGDVTYHGPGQLVGYPIVSLPEPLDVVRYVRALEAVLIDALADLGIDAGREEGLTGVWCPGGGLGTTQSKIAAIGVRVSRGRTRHGFALNVDPDLSMFEHIVPCGIRDRGVTSIARELGRPVATTTVVEAVTARFAEHFAYSEVESQAVAGARREPTATEVPVALTVGRREKPKITLRLGEGYRELKRLTRDLDLHTVCEEAGCPNIYECWADRTATFMILGDRCSRACGFCLVDTRRPLAVDEGEPARVATAVSTLDLAHAVITCVARDDLPDGGASIFVRTVHAVRAASPSTAIELLISDCKGDSVALASIFETDPDVLNHNLETVARLQRTVRPSAGYARSLAVLARAKAAGLVTKSGIMVGLGEEPAEVRGAMSDLRGVGVDILTVGQYLRPSEQHLPVVRYWAPDEFDALREHGESLGFSHVEAGALVRSSYHARQGASAARPQVAETA